MQTNHVLEKKFCDLIFAEKRDFLQVFPMMLFELEVPEIINVYQKTMKLGLNKSETDSMLLNFLALTSRKSFYDMPKMKQFSFVSSRQALFSDFSGEDLFFHLDVSLVDNDNVVLAFETLISFLYQKPHENIRFELKVNIVDDKKIENLKKAFFLFRPFLIDVNEHVNEQDILFIIQMKRNLIPSPNSAFKSFFADTRAVHEAKSTSLSSGSPVAKKKKLEFEEYSFNGAQLGNADVVMQEEGQAHTATFNMSN